jgi:hypothetical protein
VQGELQDDDATRRQAPCRRVERPNERCESAHAKTAVVPEGDLVKRGYDGERQEKESCRGRGVVGGADPDPRLLVNLEQSHDMVGMVLLVTVGRRSHDVQGPLGAPAQLEEHWRRAQRRQRRGHAARHVEHTGRRKCEHAYTPDGALSHGVGETVRQDPNAQTAGGACDFRQQFALRPCDTPRSVGQSTQTHRSHRSAEAMGWAPAPIRARGRPAPRRCPRALSPSARARPAARDQRSRCSGRPNQSAH